jgi:hypothetical protein
LVTQPGLSIPKIGHLIANTRDAGHMPKLRGRCHNSSGSFAMFTANPPRLIADFGT